MAGRIPELSPQDSYPLISQSNAHLGTAEGTSPRNEGYQLADGKIETVSWITQVGPV